jgi:hypothetical protein
VTVDIIIAGRRIRLLSRKDVIIRPDDRFTAFTVANGSKYDVYLDAMTGITGDADPGLIDPGIPYMTVMSGPLMSAGAGPGGDTDYEPDLIVEVEPGTGVIPQGAVKVFDAQLMEEVPGGVRNSGEPFWEVFSGEGVTYARVFLKGPERTALLMMPHGEKRWRIYTGEVPGSSARSGSHGFNTGHGQEKESSEEEIHVSGNFAQSPAAETSAPGHPAQPSRKGLSLEVNPLPYPLDGLLLYFLFSRSGDIMIHGSGVVSGGRGWIFSGRSGSGKTTLARIFDRAGDRVIHDDRLVVRHEEGRWVMHNTPVYRNDEPRSVALEHIWLIRHGSANMSEPVAGAEAVAMILANCIQQNWDREAAARLAAAADDLASSVRVSRLSFIPDRTIRDYLRLRKEEDISIAAYAAEDLLNAGKSISVTAGGYSMWPAIRPGDTVVISPFSEGAAAAGQVVALRRDGGFVLHRITEVITAGGRELIRTQGDAVLRADEPAGPETIAGIVQSVSRPGRQVPPPRRRSPRWLNRVWAEAHRLTASAF